MPKHFHGTAREERALAAYVKLLRAAETVHGSVTAHLDAAGLTPSQFAVLEALYHVGPLCLSELARKVLKTGGNLTMVVGNLERRGLVRRQQQKHDRRYVQAAITTAGRKLLDEIFPVHLAGIVRSMDVLSSTEQKELGNLCRKLGKGQQQAKGTGNQQKNEIVAAASASARNLPR